MASTSEPNPTVPTTEQQLLTIRQVQLKLGVSRSTLYAFFNEGRLPSVYVRKSRRVRSCDLQEFIENLPTEPGAKG